MRKLSHYVASRLAGWDVRHVFLIPGGGAMQSGGTRRLAASGRPDACRIGIPMNVQTAASEPAEERLPRGEELSREQCRRVARLNVQAAASEPGEERLSSDEELSHEQCRRDARRMSLPVTAFPIRGLIATDTPPFCDAALLRGAPLFRNTSLFCGTALLRGAPPFCDAALFRDTSLLRGSSRPGAGGRRPVIRVADYVFRRLADWAVTDTFVLTGGGAMHLNDALGREPRMRYTCMHHEQSCAMAAEAYARVSGRPAVVSVTTGPGAINALNGVFGAWTDSIPMLVISGQVKRATCMAAYGDRCAGLRQLGDQEVDIVRMAKGITKYAELVLDPNSIRYHLERAWYLAAHGRPGPCWLDIPVDVQAASVEEDLLPAYDQREDRLEFDDAELRRLCAETLRRIGEARRPVLMAGSGVRVAGAEELFRAFIGRLGIPVTTAWTAHDLVPSGHPLYCGRPGTVGDRPGNFAVQNADLLLVLGCRLHVRQISYNWQAFAPHAYKIQVDIDQAELSKPTARPDLPVHADVRRFLEISSELLDREGPSREHGQWLLWNQRRVQRYPVVEARHRGAPSPVNPYAFIERLFEKLEEGEVVVCGDGAACVVPFQAGRIKPGQRLFTNAGSASMGYDLPAAVGAAIANRGRRVVCLAGDGSIQLNLQELQTIVHHRLPVKIFVLNNGGYLSIRTTQKTFFQGNFVGESPRSGVSFPDMVRIAEAYGIPARRIGQNDCGGEIECALTAPGPFLCEVMLDAAQEFEPRLTSRILSDGRMASSPLEDLYPFLEPEELRANMVAEEA
jgi:acetolactate synthase I/II/III large subunit